MTPLAWVLYSMIAGGIGFGLSMLFCTSRYKPCPEDKEDEIELTGFYQDMVAKDRTRLRERMDRDLERAIDKKL